jgi:lysophospholipase L1-like esterase
MGDEKLSDGDKAIPLEIKKSNVVLRSLKCIVVAIVAVVLIIGLFLYFNIYLPLGEGPAGPDVPASPFNTVWNEQTVLLLGIGDSITDGFGASKGFSYFDRLISNPDGDSEDMMGKHLSKVFPKLTSLNKSESGSTSFDHIRMARQIERQPGHVFGLAVITSGGNDLIHNYGKTPPKEGAMYGATRQQAQPWVDNYRQRLDEMVVTIHSRFPGGCQIFLANIYDPSDGTGDTKEFFTGLPVWADGLALLADYNRIIVECATQHDYVHLVDIHTPFLGHGIHCRKFWTGHYVWSDPTYWYFINIEDPSERGYDAIRRMFLLRMIEVFVD